MSFGPVECAGFLALVVGISIPIFLLVRGVTVIPEGQVAVVERRGRFTRVLHAGQHLLLPGGEKIRALVPLQDTIFDTGPQNVLLKDLAELQLSAAVQYHIARQPVSDGTRRWHEINSDAVYHAIYSSENWQEATQSAARATLGETFALLDLRADVLSVADWQEKVAAQVRHRLNEKTRRWGVQVTAVSFSSVQFPPAVRESLNRMDKAKREAELREIEAASLKEVGEKLGLSPTDLVNWRYIETLREIAKDPKSRIVVSPEPFVDTGASRAAVSPTNVLSTVEQPEGIPAS